MQLTAQPREAIPQEIEEASRLPGAVELVGRHHERDQAGSGNGLPDRGADAWRAPRTEVIDGDDAAGYERLTREPQIGPDWFEQMAAIKVYKLCLRQLVWP